MKKYHLSKWTNGILLALFFGSIFISSCKKDDPIDPIDAPTAAFSTGTIEGLTVTFINASVGGDTYSWEFGDGNTSTEEAPTHTYDAEGTYTVKLTTTNSEGSSDISLDVTVVEANKLLNFIAGKSWQAQRGENLAYGLGPDDGTWSFDDLDMDGNKALAPLV